MTTPLPSLIFLITIFSLLNSLNSFINSPPLPLLPNTTLQSTPNRTFTLGFITPNTQLPHHYLAIYYTYLPTRTVVWVANRRHPLTNLSTTTLSLSSTLLLSDGNSVLWSSDNTSPATTLRFLDSGNLLLLDSNNAVVWESFHSPTDTWLPGMNITSTTPLTCWTSLWDPSPGRYTLQLRPPEYGEIELVYNGGDAVVRTYWDTGEWSADGGAFADVPEMTVPYIYKFYFVDPFKKTASFGFDEVAVAESGPPLTRFHLDYTGELRQYTWSAQMEYWNMFWVRPESRCRAYGLCGPNGVCYGESEGLWVC